MALARLKYDAGDADSAIRYAREVLAISPTVDAARLILGKAYLQKRLIGSAITEFERYVERNPADPRGLLDLGAACLAQGDYAAAEAHFDAACKADPMGFDALAGLVDLYIIQETPAKALQRLNQEIARRPDQPRLYEMLGRVHASRKDYSKAEAAFRKVLTLDKNSIMAYALLGNLFIVQNAVEKAIAEYEHILKIDPRSIQAYTLLAGIYQSQNNARRAVQYYREALKIDPRFPVAANNLAWQLSETGGDLEEALSLAKIAKEKLPDSVNVTDTLAWIYYRRAAFRTAIDLLEECIHQEPKNPTFQYHLGNELFQIRRPSGR